MPLIPRYIANKPGFAAIANASAPPLPPPPSVYTGPFDIESGGLFGYSLRALANARIGQPCTTIRRDSDNTTMVFDPVSGGAFDTAGAATFIGGGNGYHSIWNDQSGNSYDAASVGNSTDPLYVASDVVVNNRSIVDYIDNTDAILFGILETSVNVPSPTGGQWTAFAVARLQDNAIGDAQNTSLFYQDSVDGSATRFTTWYWLGETGNPHNPGVLISTWSTPSVPLTYSQNSGLGNFFDGNYHVMEITFNQPGSTIHVLLDGVDVGVSTSFTSSSQLLTAVSSKLIVGGSIQGGSLRGLSARYGELLLWPHIVTAPQRSLIRQNIGTWYGITVAP